jgi:hypothetical protein
VGKVKEGTTVGKTQKKAGGGGPALKEKDGTTFVYKISTKLTNEQCKTCRETVTQCERGTKTLAHRATTKLCCAPLPALLSAPPLRALKHEGKIVRAREEIMEGTMRAAMTIEG